MTLAQAKKMAYDEYGIGPVMAGMLWEMTRHMPDPEKSFRALCKKELEG